MSRLELTWTLYAPDASHHIHPRPGTHLSRAGMRSIPALMPQGRELEMMSGLSALGPEPYRLQLLALRRHYVDRLSGLLEKGELAPGALQAQGDRGPVAVGAGTSVVCSCPPDRSHRGLCHRWWAAPVLAQAGWQVWVDGYQVGALRDYSRLTVDPEEELGYHLADLETDGYRLQRRKDMVTPHRDWSWWRFGVLIRDKEKEIGRIWGEDPDSGIAAGKALMALRVWATGRVSGK